MDERINELESLALAARENKGRMDAASREKASELLASIWEDSSIDPASTLQLMEDIKAEAIAEAVRSCWPRMDISRRIRFRRWVPAPSTEKSYRRLAFLVASVLEVDGETALHWLGLLIPPGRKSLSKESRAILASILFGERVLSFDTLVREHRSSTELLRILAALFEVAADPSLSVSSMTRSRLASAILGYLSGPDAPEDNLSASDLRSKIAADAKRWPTALRDQVIPATAATYAPLPARPHADAIPDAEPQKPAAPEPIASVPAPAGAGPLKEELPRLQTELSKRMSDMTREVDLLRRAQDCIAKLEEAAERVEAQREALMRELQAVRDSLRQVEGERDSATADSAREIRRANELATAVEQMKMDLEDERKRLGHQISANASGRIEEFKNRLGLNLSRLLVDLPGKEAEVSSELGKVLLLQFHQLLDALRQEGIETLSRVRS